MSDWDSVWENLRGRFTARRADIRRTQAEVARLMGTTQSAVSDLESGRTNDPCINTVARWATALDLEVELHIVERVRTTYAVKPREVDA